MADRYRAERRLASVLNYAVYGIVVLLAGGLVWAFVVNGSQTAEIQSQRERNIRESCEAQNRRHDGTIGVLDRLIAQRAKSASPAEVRQMRSSRAYTVLLIDALAPHQDCADVVARSLR